MGGLIEVLEEIRGKNILIAAHKNADPDALASALGVRNLLEGKALIFFPEGLNSLSKKLIEKLSISIKYSVKCEELKKIPDYLIVVDTGSRAQLGCLSSLVDETKLILIDHHSTGDLTNIAEATLVEPHAASTSEIIVDIYRQLKRKIPKEEAIILLAGIIYDSGRFFHVGPLTFSRVQYLLDNGADYSLALSLLKMEPEFSERMARVKGALRAKFYRADNTQIIIALTHVGAYEASVARALIQLGADIAIVLSERKEATRMVIRALKRTIEKHGIDVGRDIASKIAEAAEESGGGHETAAMAVLKKTAEEATTQILKLVENVLGAKMEEINP